MTLFLPRRPTANEAELSFTLSSLVVIVELSLRDERPKYIFSNSSYKFLHSRPNGDIILQSWIELYAAKRHKRNKLSSGVIRFLRNSRHTITGNAFEAS